MASIHLSFYSKYFVRYILGMDGEPWSEATLHGLSASQFQLLISVLLLSPSAYAEPPLPFLLFAFCMKNTITEETTSKRKFRRGKKEK